MDSTCIQKASLLLLILLLVGLPACDLTDPTGGVENPDITRERVLDQPVLADPWLRGVKRQAALVYNEIVTPMEISSDNYFNSNNFYLVHDDLQYMNSTQHPDIEDLQFDIADLRESADFGLTEVRENDENTTDRHLAGFHFYKGLSYLLAGLYFKTLPAEINGPPLSSEENLQLALSEIEEALQLSSDDEQRTGYHLAKARAHFYLGEKEEAVSAADAAISADGNDDYVMFAVYDGENGPTNTMQSAVHERFTDDLQPLPRLDFLDPKYWDYNKTGDDEDDIPIFKIEEAYLIKAQALLADGALDPAKDVMNDILDIVADRPTDNLVDNEGRTYRQPESRPDDSEWVVRASPQDPYREGLVLDRDGETVLSIPKISGTSVTESMIDPLSTVDEALEMLYLLRQEIFMAEGIRFIDLGMKWPVTANEAQFNENVTEEDLQPFVPDLLPAQELDTIELDFDQKQATIRHNVNRILSQNRTSQHVVPFF